MSDDYVNYFEVRSKDNDKKNATLAKLPKVWTGTELMTTEFPPQRWAVENLLPTGAILLVGAYKIGKSWFLLQLADSITRGKPFLGHITTTGSVLYLALEDGPARIQRRAARMGIVLQDNVFVNTEWLRGKEGLIGLRAWLDEHKDVKLVALDTLSRWQDDYSENRNDAWARDTKRIVDLKTIADQYDITILIVHHRAKAAREDAFQSTAGTNALQAAADGALLLEKQRGQNKAKLSLVGRDIPERDLAIEFQPENCTWRELAGDPVILRLGLEKKAIINAIMELGGKAKVGQVAEKVGKERSNVGHLIRAMAIEGILYKLEFGAYGLQPIPSIPTVPSLIEDNIPTGNDGSTGNNLELCPL